MYILRLDGNYAADMRVLANGVTDDNAGLSSAPRRRRAGSTDTADIQVFFGTRSIVATIRESDLYVIGFRNAEGRPFFFKGMNGGSQELRFNCSYTDSDGMALFMQGPSKDARTPHNRQSIVKALGMLADFRGGKDVHLIVGMALLAFMVSEAIRFTYIHHQVRITCSDDAMTFALADYEIYMKNWAALSKGEVPKGAVANRVYTSY
ncbi:Ribosome inactivating protein [Novosphingobium sp. CF614]|uniref:ribosome-inactivating family protein n=1 Tax=Novosphingobium sp. CF614 TaxID=1884364 RepID=UPI0008F08138|nr:ribosome-inactivating family protein [Novosphingobium sp. CF614]SFG17918.1 Ribosome inactivating protein [Novosphingobium sp. CF614]